MSKTRIVEGIQSSRLSPADLSYAGSFYLPQWRPGVRWGYGGHAMTHDLSADAIIAAGHAHYQGQIGWASIPEVGGRAEELHPFADVRGELVSSPVFAGSPKLDRLGDIAIVDGRIWASWYTYYAVQTLAELDKPSFLSNSRALDDPRGMYKAGPYGDEVFHQKRTSNYLCEIPKEWADEHVAGKRLLAGKGDGPGNALNSHGPTLYAVSTEPDPLGILDATLLCHYPAEKGIPDWSPCDQWEGIAWIQGTVLVSGRRGRGPPCYGTPQECNGCDQGKGYHCDPYGVDLLFYSADDLAEVAHGQRDPTDVLPYAVVDLTPELRDTCHYRMGAMAYDTKRSRIYIVQTFGENPIVHAWDVRDPEAHRVAVSLDGEATEFQSANRQHAMAGAIEFLAGALRRSITEDAATERASHG